MTIKPKFILALFLVSAAIYGFWGYKLHPSSRDRVASRAALAQASTGSIKVGVLWSDTPSNGFLEGCQVGVQLAKTRRPLELVPLKVNNERTDRFRADFTALLSRNPEIVAVMAAVPDQFVAQAEVICESYGVALFLSNLESPLVADPGFEFSIRMNPNYGQYARAITTSLPLVSESTSSVLNVGVFFDAGSALGGEAVNSLLEECQTQNSSVLFVRSLRTSVAQGIIDPAISVRQLRDDLAFQVGLTRQAGVVQSFLRDFASAREIETDLPLSVALDRATGLTKEIQVRFVQAYLPNQTDYRPDLSKLGLSDLDGVIMASDLEGTANLLRQLRANECHAPILCVDSQQADVVAKTIGNFAGKFYMLANHDPAKLAQTYPELVAAFRQRQSANPEDAVRLGEMSLLGYDSVRLLGEVVESTGRTVPQEIVNTLKYSSATFETLGDRYTFDKHGVPQGRELDLLKFEGGQLRKVESKA